MQDLVGDDHSGGSNGYEPVWKVPVPLTPLIGREQERAAICTLLMSTDVRLLTLLGPGGIGKTRLSFQLAVEVRDAFDDGVCFVPLAILREPEQLMPTIAHELALPETGLSPFEQVSEFLREKQVLLILDNFEQIVAAAPEVAHLLAVCPSLKILITSRIALRVGSDRPVVISPLALPDLKQPADKEAIAGCAVVSLFVQLAQAHLQGFDVTTTNARVLAEICVRLDGFSLAIELAAARIKLLPPHALLPRLRHAHRLTRVSRSHRRSGTMKVSPSFSHFSHRFLPPRRTMLLPLRYIKIVWLQPARRGTR